MIWRINCPSKRRSHAYFTPDELRVLGLLLEVHDEHPVALVVEGSPGHDGLGAGRAYGHGLRARLPLGPISRRLGELEQRIVVARATRLPLALGDSSGVSKRDAATRKKKIKHRLIIIKPYGLSREPLALLVRAPFVE